MDSNAAHYQTVTKKRGKTKFASCAYEDRFDPFLLNKNDHLRKLYSGLFQNFLGDIQVAALLDIGCGTGIYFDVLSAHAARIDAIDSSADMIEIAQKYCVDTGLTKIHPQVGSSGTLNFKDNSFDVVVALDLLHHVQDFSQTIKEVKRVLKPNGCFFVFEPNILNPLMFLAHAIPAEERLALRRNAPSRLRSLLGESFKTLKWEGVCAMITRSEGIKGLVFDTYLAFFKMLGIQHLYTRQAWIGQKTS